MIAILIDRDANILMHTNYTNTKAPINGAFLLIPLKGNAMLIISTISINLYIGIDYAKA